MLDPIIGIGYPTKKRHNELNRPFPLAFICNYIPEDVFNMVTVNWLRIYEEVNLPMVM